MSAELRVLAVDDDSNDVVFLQRAFAKGCPDVPVHFVASGREALEYLSGAKPYANRKKYPLPTLLILDLKMPEINGFDIMQWVREQPGIKDMKIAVLSGSDLEADITKASRFGVVAYYVKPNNPDELVGIVKELCDKWASQEIDPGVLR